MKKTKSKICPRCIHKNLKTGKQCSRSAACSVGCPNFCWQHAYNYEKLKNGNIICSESNLTLPNLTKPKSIPIKKKQVIIENTSSEEEKLFKYFNDILNENKNPSEYAPFSRIALIALREISKQFDYVCVPLEKRKKYKKKSSRSIVYNVRMNKWRIPDFVNKAIMDCLENPEIKFIVINLLLEQEKFDPVNKVYIPEDAHANVFIIDTESKEIERFDPQILEESTKQTEFFKKKFYNLYGLKYIPPIEICIKPYQAFELQQAIQETGYCIAWSIFYFHLRILHPELSRQEAFEMGLKIIHQNPVEHKFTHFIKQYGSYLIKLLKKDPEWLDEQGPELLELYFATNKKN